MGVGVCATRHIKSREQPIRALLIPELSACRVGVLERETGSGARPSVGQDSCCVGARVPGEVGGPSMSALEATAFSSVHWAGGDPVPILGGPAVGRQEQLCHEE